METNIVLGPEGGHPDGEPASRQRNPRKDSGGSHPGASAAGGLAVRPATGHLQYAISVRATSRNTPSSARLPTPEHTWPNTSGT